MHQVCTVAFVQFQCHGNKWYYMLNISPATRDSKKLTAGILETTTPCKCTTNTTPEYPIVVFCMGRIILNFFSLCSEYESRFATDSGKLLIGHQRCPYTSSIALFWYRSYLKYFPLKAASLAEQLMLT